jgi:hypothetical protein
MSETINPFDVSSYATEGQTVPNTETVQSDPVQTEPVQSEPAQAEPVQSDPVQPIVTQTEPVKSEPQSSEPTPFEWNNDLSKTIYEKLVSKDVSELADILYEQKVLSSLDSMDDSDIIKLQMAYEYPDLTPDEIEEEFNSKYNVEMDIDEDMLSEEEVASKRKQLEKQQKSIQREMKKMVREAKASLQEMKKDIDFPDILSQLQAGNQPISDDAISQYLSKQQEQQQGQYQEARKMFEQSIDNGLKAFDGFTVNYKDEDVQFDGKYNLTPEDKTALQGVLQSFDLESFYGNRYFKDGSYDTKQLAEDVYFLQNRDKIVNSMVTQAVSKAKSDILKSMKNIDYSNQPRPSTSANNSDYDQMVSTMFRL